MTRTPYPLHYLSALHILRWTEQPERQTVASVRAAVAAEIERIELLGALTP